MGIPNDLVGVDPKRLEEAASALENLRDVLAANVPVIVRTMNEYWSSGAGTPVSLAPLQQAAHRSVDDAASMRSRSDLAQEYILKGGQNIDVVSGGVAYILWDEKSVNRIDTQLQARKLAAALKSGNRAEFLAVETDIKDHQYNTPDDKQWLADFWSQPSIADTVAGLARMLFYKDSKPQTVLSKSDQQMLSAYASSLATACNLNVLSKQQASNLTSAFTTAAKKSPWSAAMLVNFGPGGTAYGTGTGADVLAGITRSVLNARENNSISYPGSPPQLGNYEPAAAVLRIDAQNKIAATHVLGGPNGARYARDLLQTPNISYQAPVGGIAARFGGTTTVTTPLNQNVVGDFLNAATQGTDPAAAPPTGTSLVDKESAQAALNIIVNTPAPGQFTVSAPVRKALLDTFNRYMPDIAASVNGVDQNTQSGPAFQAYVNGRYDGPYTFVVPDNGTSLQAFLQQIAHDKQSAAQMQTDVLTRFGAAFAGQMKNGPSQVPSSDVAGDLAALYGEVDTAEKNLKYSAAEQEDLRNETLKNLIAVGIEVSKVTSFGLSKPVGTVKKVIASMLRARKAPYYMYYALNPFPTDNAANAASQFTTDEAVRKMLVEIPMAQGLIGEGIAKPQPAWFKNGKIDLSTPQSAQAFENWWNELKGHSVANLPKMNNPPGKPLTPNEQNGKLLEQWWYQYGAGMQLAYQKDGAWS